MNKMMRVQDSRGHRRPHLYTGPRLPVSRQIAPAPAQEALVVPHSAVGLNSSRLEIKSGLSSLSTQAFVGPSSGPLIAGFVLGGPGPKRVLLRAAGPALAELGCANWLSYPRIRLFDAGGVVRGESEEGEAKRRAIECWSENVGAFPFRAETGDAALIATLQPGTYSAHVSSDSRVARGVAVVEACELTEPDGASREERRFINLSALAWVSSAGRGLVTRFTVSGNSPRRLLIRGVGPGLCHFGVNDGLIDPRLELYSSSTLLTSNENWETLDRAEINALNAKCGAFPLQGGSCDTALIITLAPCAYTIVLRSIGGSAGRGLIEVYDAPE